MARTTDAVGWLLLGIWPFPVLLHAWRRAAVRDRELLSMLFALGLGTVVAGAPLVAYHLAHGSIAAWFSDSVLDAVSLPTLDFVKTPGYAVMTVLALRGLGSGDPAASLNGAFWVSLLLLSAVLGVMLLRALVRGSRVRTTYERLAPLPPFEVFRRRTSGPTIQRVCTDTRGG